MSQKCDEMTAQELDELRLQRAEMIIGFWDGGPRAMAARDLTMHMADEYRLGLRRGVRRGALVALVFNAIGWAVGAYLWW